MEVDFKWDLHLEILFLRSLLVQILQLHTPLLLCNYLCLQDFKFWCSNLVSYLLLILLYLKDLDIKMFDLISFIQIQSNFDLMVVCLYSWFLHYFHLILIFHFLAILKVLLCGPFTTRLFAYALNNFHKIDQFVTHVLATSFSLLDHQYLY